MGTQRPYACKLGFPIKELNITRITPVCMRNEPRHPYEGKEETLRWEITLDGVCVCVGGGGGGGGGPRLMSCEPS